MLKHQIDLHIKGHRSRCVSFFSFPFLYVYFLFIMFSLPIFSSYFLSFFPSDHFTQCVPFSSVIPSRVFPSNLYYRVFPFFPSILYIFSCQILYAWSLVFLLSFVTIFIIFQLFKMCICPWTQRHVVFLSCNFVYLWCVIFSFL